MKRGYNSSRKLWLITFVLFFLLLVFFTLRAQCASKDKKISMFELISSVHTQRKKQNMYESTKNMRRVYILFDQYRSLVSNQNISMKFSVRKNNSK
jgi:hypothetical protein